MDDFFIIAKTRWQLRRAVQKLNQYFQHFGFQQHPDKTFIGPTHKGTDWMGYWLTHEGVQSVAPRALTNHLIKLRRLYEQTRHLPAKQQQMRVVDYVRRWRKWLGVRSDTPVAGARLTQPRRAGICTVRYTNS